MKNLEGLLNTLRSARKLHAERDGRQKAATYLTSVATSAGAAGETQEEAAAREVLAEHYRENGDEPRALEAYEQARAAYQKVNDRYSQSRVLTEMSEIYEKLGNTQEAKRYAELASSALRTN
jgi:tetratricopeptide (TPR) repeat protein